MSCSADRQALGKITKEGVFLEALERDVGKYLPEVDEAQVSPEVTEFCAFFACCVVAIFFFFLAVFFFACFMFSCVVSCVFLLCMCLLFF